MPRGIELKFLESRYALRELEGAIGYDTRRLEDGRRAEFLHTVLHRHARRRFFERRDMAMLLGMTLVSVSELLSKPAFKAKTAVGLVEERRQLLADELFPYLHQDTKRQDDGSEYDVYFKELDAIMSKMEMAAGGGLEGGAVGAEDAK